MFILYCKLSCPDCIKAKNLLQNEEKIIINCDNFLEHDRENFIRTMRRKTNQDRIVFPMIFIDDDYLGGINELTDYVVYELNEEF